MPSNLKVTGKLIIHHHVQKEQIILKLFSDLGCLYIYECEWTLVTYITTFVYMEGPTG